DAAFIMRLLFLGGVIFRVLRKVAMRARFGDMLDDARTLHRLALLQFDLEGGIAAGGHRNLFHHSSSSFNFMRTNPRATHKRRNRTPSWLAGSQSRGLHCRSIAGRARPAKGSGFGKITLQRADLKVPAQIGADALGSRHGTRKSGVIWHFMQEGSSSQ